MAAGLILAHTQPVMQTPARMTNMTIAMIKPLRLAPPSQSGLLAD